MKKVFAFLLLFIGIVSLWFYWHIDGFKTINPYFAGSCEAVNGTGSAEDIDVDRDADILFISAADRLGRTLGQSDGQGEILVYDLAAAPAQYTIGRQPGVDDFRPHGISLYRSPDGSRRLFAINHRASGEETIEVFDISADHRLNYVKTIKHPLFESPNDLVAVGPEQFYVGNDSGAGNGLQRALEFICLAAYSKIVVVNGIEASVVVDGFASAGGINASNDGRSIYISATADRSVAVYQRDPNTGALSYQQSAELGISVDNIDVAADGSLWVAGHPSVFKLMGHFFSGGEKPAPSQVYRIPVIDGRLAEPETILTSLGSDLSASSVAVQHRDAFYVGGITSRRMLVCRQR